MSKQYPTNAPSGADFVQFSHSEYNSRGGGGNGGAGGITLYMPEKTPAVGNPQNWTSTNSYFAGPLGDMKRGIIETMADAASINSTDDAGRVVKNAVEKFKNAAGSAGGAGRQLALEEAGKFMGLSANQILSVTKGEIYNPNTELFYNAPNLRQFTFNFGFAPRSRGDANAAFEIIKEFKAYSSPDDTGNGKYKIPHVWHIKYSNSKYNRFKPAACVDVSVDYNGSLDQYMTFEDGSPITISLTLVFKEVEIVVRNDHLGSVSGF